MMIRRRGVMGGVVVCVMTNPTCSCAMLAMMIASAVLVGCASDAGPGDEPVITPAAITPRERPATVTRTAVRPDGGGVVSPAGGGGLARAAVRSADLDYLDALERRPAISNDDAITGMLLITTGRIGRDYAARVAEAQRAGLIPGEAEGPPPAPRRAASAGDVSRLVAVALRSVEPSLAAGDAGAGMNWLRQRGALPAAMNETDLPTGPQFLAVLLAVGEALDAVPAAGGK